MQCTLTEAPDLRPRGDPECVELRVAAWIRDGTTARDASVFMKRETEAMARSGYMYWRCGSGIVGRRLRQPPTEVPPGLDRLPPAPDVLLVCGEPDLSVPRVAMVGPRRPDDYGTAMATAFSKALAARGVIIVSGGACGIDTTSHESALDAGGRTICVLGSGFDAPHPPSNRDLFRRIGRTPGCCLISEYAPDMPAQKRFFPDRNRLVAALSDAVVVVQAAFGSGALITGRIATLIGVPLFAVPADAHWTRSAGSNDLLGRGARALCRPSDLAVVPELADVDFTVSWKKTVNRPAGSGSPWNRKGTQKSRLKPSEAAAGLLELILKRHAETGAGADPDFLAEAGRTSAASVQATLLELELSGLIRRIPGGSAIPATGME